MVSMRVNLRREPPLCPTRCHSMMTSQRTRVRRDYHAARRHLRRLGVAADSVSDARYDTISSIARFC